MARVAVGMALVLIALLAGCDQKPQVSSSSSGLEKPRSYDKAALAEGEKIYRANCAKCHGKNAEGDPNWRSVGSDGKYPPPPLNGSGHAWHHSRSVLRNVIKNGSPPGQGNMPAWGSKLSDQQIELIIDYFQSLWPEPVYSAWVEMQQSNR